VATALSSDDQAPTVDPDTHTSVDATKATAATRRVLNDVPPSTPATTTTLTPSLAPIRVRRLGNDRDSQAAYRPRDIAKQCETTRTSDQPELQVRSGFGAFAQVSGLGLSDLGDRRSGVQISPARPPETTR